MPKLEMTLDEGKTLLEFMERYLLNLRIEIINTDDREFRRDLRRREDVVQTLMERLKESVS